MRDFYEYGWRSSASRQIVLIILAIMAAPLAKASATLSSLHGGRARLSSGVSEIKLRRLAAMFLILALAGCAPVATGQGPAPYAPYSPEDMHDRGGDGGGGGGEM